MSLAKLEQIRCPCGEVFEAELWNAINAHSDPELKEALVAGEINVVTCPVCSQIFYAEHFLLYQDAPNELLAFVYPISFESQATICMSRMKDDFNRAMNELGPTKRLSYDPILLFGLDSLVEIINMENEEIDEANILKYAADELGLSLVHLHPSKSRPEQLPRTLPKAHVKGGAIRDEILSGLRRLVEYNEHLALYNRLLHKIEHNSNWTLDKKLIKKTLS